MKSSACIVSNIPEHHNASAGSTALFRMHTPIPDMGHLLSEPCTACAAQDGKTLLHHAVKAGHAEVADLLIEYGAEIDATDNVSGLGWLQMASTTLGMMHHSACTQHAL
jgi:hypothetical protein